MLISFGIGIARIVSTYQIFSQTFDEPLCIGNGMEWLDSGKFTHFDETPPLARIVTAVGPFLDGARSMGKDDCLDDGNEILHGHGGYFRTLTLARLGVLPFFALATFFVWIWTRKLFGNFAALFAVILFTNLPPVLAHSCVAATDMTFTALFLAGLLSLALWCKRVTLFRSLLLGFTVGLAILAKLSALVFIPSCGCLMIILYRLQKSNGKNNFSFRHRLLPLGLSVLVCLIVIWAGYLFSFSSIVQKESRPHKTIDEITGTEGALHDLAYRVVEAKIPAPGFIRGISKLINHNNFGHTSYLLGECRRFGWWYYYLFALAVKTPLPFLILAFIGQVVLVIGVRRSKEWLSLVPVVSSLAILLFSLMSNINIGVRHILPIYPLLTICAGFGAVSLWKLRKPKLLGPILVSVLLLWQIVSTAVAHPDYLAYFNELAGNKPEQILVDSNLDWGQDLKRLADTLHQRGINEIAIKYFGSADLSRHGLPTMRKLVPYEFTTGWVAISITNAKTGNYFPPYDHYSWLEQFEPIDYVGKSIKLYHIPEAEYQ
jgi:4-amino-4-deoxy-L-arabinose transferase-like glycosyltransferase